LEHDGLLIMAQVDHLTGEEIGWALEVLSVPGVRNRNLIPTLTKKGRTGYLLLLDVDKKKEEEICRLLVESLSIYGYHRIETRHVHHGTVIREIPIEVRCGEQSIEDRVRMKGMVEPSSSSCCLESDDLFSLQKRIREELGITLSPKDLRRRIESLAEIRSVIRIQLDL